MDELFKELAGELRAEFIDSAGLSFEMSLETIGTDITINGITKRVILESASKFTNDKVIAARIGELSVGDKIRYQNTDWLVTTTPTNNDVYLKAILKRCNSTLIIPNIIKVMTGKDWRDFPKYQETEGEPIRIPCVVESHAPTANADDQPIMLPDGKLRITVPYHDKVKLNLEFDMFGQKYKVMHIDWTQLINSLSGVLILTCDMVS